eukprot:TRINITY_DN16785_c0_g1_i1.p1 TRINITY_DN16785_c0_g1~~TRINITY_DN16785_c0_g1_i1.p1  ORF type:complete len:81 (-),score=10.19 TRINITY_DN16785_c0_g1_i1:58-300(-)
MDSKDMKPIDVDSRFLDRPSFVSEVHDAVHASLIKEPYESEYSSDDINSVSISINGGELIIKNCAEINKCWGVYVVTKNE